MANYQRSKIRIYAKKGKIDAAVLRSKVEALKEANNIYENIYIWHTAEMRFAEVRFTAKRYPYMIEDIFTPEEYDLWIINSDEGGGPDGIVFTGSGEENKWEKALYRFDRIDLFGTSTILHEELKLIFGYGAGYLPKQRETNKYSFGVRGLYSANNFFYDKNEGNILTASLADEPKDLLPQESGEFWDMLFHSHSMQFKEKFYEPVSRGYGKKNEFPWLKRVEFYNNDQLSNVIEWKETEYGSPYWHHRANDGFWNCITPEFYAYKQFD